MTVSPKPQTQSRSGIDDTLLGTALVAVALVVVVAAVLFIWLRVAPTTPLSFERYFPAVHGAALSYRITNPDGSVTYRSRNLYRDRANLLVGAMPLDAFSALFDAAGLDLEKISTADALARLGELQLVRINDLESDAQGQALNRTASYVLLINDGLQQFAVNEIGIVPPIPLIPSSESPQTIAGNLNGSIPFRITQQIESRGAFRTALGEFSDCIRVKSELLVNENTTTNQTWYCAGIGEVADELTDSNGTRRTEIVAASVGAFNRGSTPLAGDRNLNASLERSFDAPLQGTAMRLFEHKEDSASRGITTNILPINGNLFYGTGSGAVVLLDRATGQELWRFQLGDAVFSTPVVANGIAYFGSTDKKVYALRVTDGTFVWAFPTRDIVSAMPLVYNGNVYIASEDRHIYALDADTGQQRWSFSGGGAFIAPPVIAGDKLIVSNDDGRVFALDPTTGGVRWEFSAGRGVTAPVTAANGVLYFGSFDSQVLAVAQETGKMLWSRDVGNPVKQPVIVSNGRVYVTLDEEVLALDAATGKPIWFYDDNATLAGAAVLMGDQLWLAKTGGLISLDANSGALTYEVPTTDSSTDTGISSDGKELYVGFFDGTLLGFSGANK